MPRFEALLSAAESATRDLKRVADQIRRHRPNARVEPGTLEAISDRMGRAVYEYRRSPGDRERAELFHATGACARKARETIQELAANGDILHANILETVVRRLQDANFDASADTVPLSVDEVTPRDDEGA